MSRTKAIAVMTSVFGVLGGLSQPDLPFITGFLTWTLGLPFRAASVILSLLEGFGRWAEITAMARRFGAWKRGSIDLAEATGAWFAPIENGINQPINDLMNIQNGVFGDIFDLIAGAADTVGDLWDTLYGYTSFFRNLGDGSLSALNPGGDTIKELKPVGDLFDLLFGWMGAIADFFYWVRDFLNFFGGLTAIESIVFLVGLMMVIAPLVVILRRIAGIAATAGASFGLSLIVEVLYGLPKLIRSILDMLAIMGVGIGLMVWATSPLFGSLFILGSGVALTTVGLLEDNGALGSYGVPTMTLGIMASLAGFGVGFLGYVVMTLVIVYLYTSLVDYVDTDLQRLIEVGAV